MPESLQLLKDKLVGSLRNMHTSERAKSEESKRIADEAIKARQEADIKVADSLSKLQLSEEANAALKLQLTKVVAQLSASQEVSSQLKAQLDSVGSMIEQAFSEFETQISAVKDVVTEQQTQNATLTESVEAQVPANPTEFGDEIVIIAHNSEEVTTTPAVAEAMQSTVGTSEPTSEATVEEALTEIEAALDAMYAEDEDEEL